METLVALTHPQRRIWFGELTAPGEPFANITLTIDLDCRPDADLLTEAVQNLVSRHDALRIQLVDVGGAGDVFERIKQKVVAFAPVPVPRVDGRGWSDDDMRRWGREQAAMAFTLLESPLVEFTIVERDDRNVLLFKVHHLVADGRTHAVVAGELRTFCERRLGLTDASTPLPEIGSYLDFLTAERDWLASPEAAAQREKWLERFNTLPEAGEFPPPVVREGGIKSRRIAFDVPATVTEVTARFGREHGVSPFKMVLAATAAHFARVYGAPDVVFSIAHHGRPRNMMDRAGMFVDTVPIRIQVDLDKTFLELVRQVSATMRRDLAVARPYPYDLLVEDLRKQHPGFTSLFQVNIVDVSIPGLERMQTEYCFPDSNPDALSIQVNLLSGKCDGVQRFALDTHLSQYTEDETDALGARFFALIEDAVTRPDVPVRQLAIMPDSERRLVIEGFNQTRHDFGTPGATVVTLFEEQARRQPDALALVAGDERLTYGDLDTQSRALAKRLRALGVGKDTVVGILTERTASLLRAPLAVVRAGGAYVPMDPAYPGERLLYFLTDSAAPVLLAQRALMPKVEGFAGTVLDIDDPSLYVDPEPDTALPAPSPADMAYVIYTSGSTGKPKGVMVEHRTLINTCQGTVANYGLSPDDRYAHLIGFSFDAAVVVTFPPLVAGTASFIVPEAIRPSPRQLHDFFEANGITSAVFPTQLAEQFIAVGPCEGMRRLIMGGDRFRQFRDVPYQIWNEYGPTECTVLATRYLVTEAADNIPIGRPIANTRAYVLDGDQQPLPVGAVGELCLAGGGVTRGYLGRPDLTAEKFVDDPFVAGDRMYHTGDLARWLPDGNLQFIGRRDAQVKIRGYRIETGEIEQCLVGHRSVTDAAVVARRDTRGFGYLCAYVVLADEVSDDELRAHLAASLPEYMVPPFIERMQALPLTPNGKVDRKALPEPTAGPGTTAYAPPSNPVEETLVAIWEAVLDVKPIGIHDSFFTLGGHSLKAAMVQARVADELGVTLPLADIFRVPTVAGLAPLVAARAAVQAPPIAHDAALETTPLAPPQTGLFALGRLGDIGTAYNIPMVQMIHGEIDADRLEAALRTVVARHDALRVSFAENDGVPRMVVHRTVPFALARIDRGADADPQEVARALIKPFELSKAPLMRATLARLGPGRSLLVIDTHHLVFDGVSAVTVFEEIAAAYASRELPEPPVTYLDFAAWAKEQAASPRVEAQRTFWLEQLRGELPVLELPTDLPRPKEKRFEGERVRVLSDETLTQEVKAAASALGVTMHQLLLSTYAAWLFRHSGQDDVIVGTPVAGRVQPGLERVVGMFVNTLPIRMFPASDKTFRALVSETRDTAIAALDRQEVPFREIVSHLKLARDPGRNPLYDALFAFQNAGDVAFEGPGFRTEPFLLESGTAQLDLTLDSREVNGRIELVFEFATSLFKAETIRRWAAHFLVLLRSAVRTPDAPLAALDMLDADERERLLQGDVSPLAVPDITLHGAFREAARRFSERPALAFGELRLDYAALDRATDQLAATLREQGLKPGAIGACLFRRGASFVVAALSVMKAGAAYLPIDPEYPADRIAFMLADSGATVLLTEPSLDGLTPSYEGARVHVSAEALANSDGVSLDEVATPADGAYVIYTSGSTGLPKGVLVEHRNIVNLCAWHHDFHAVTAHDRAAAYSGFGFDASIWEIFPFLLAGAEVYVVPEEVRLSVEDLNTYFTRHGVTITNLPTQLAEQFVETVERTTLRTLVTGGDALRTFRPRPYRLVNEYGPTETTISATAYVVTEAAANIPIGRPVANTWAYIVGGGGSLQPDGVPGELCLAGAQVARGYLGRPELTAQKFADNPFTDDPRVRRMYHTGDRVRRLADGNLEYLGRLDQQVKIRGYRIELGEIEQRLLAHDAVTDAAVLAIDDGHGGKALCAWCVVTGAWDESALREHVGLTLPAYMVPASFVRMDAIPLTPNGKVDRRALPAPVARAAETAAYEAPSGAREEALAEAFRQVLGTREPSALDDFFALGGDSIQAIRLASNLLTRGLKLDVRDLFRHSTIRALAPHLAVAVAAAEEIEETGVPVPLTPIQHWLFTLPAAVRPHFDQSVHLQARERVDADRLRRAIDTVVGRHDALRFAWSDGEGGVVERVRAMGDGDAFYFEEVALEDGADLAETIAAVADRLHAHVDLTRGPLVRVALLHAPDGDHVIVVVHHLSVDGVSWRILTEDLTAAYEGSALPPSTWSFARWARGQVAAASSADILCELPYWQEIAAHDCPSIPLDAPLPSGARTASSTRKVTVTLPAADTTSLLTTAHAAYGTRINDLLLAGLALAMRRWTGLDQLGLLMEGHGRESVVPGADISRTVGWFTSLFPVVLDTRGVADDDVGRIIRRVKETFRRIPRNGVGAGILQTLTPPDLKPGLTAGRVTSMGFNYLGRFDEQADDGAGAFRLARLSVGHDMGPDFPAEMPLDLNSYVLGGALTVDLTHDPRELRNETVEKLAALYLDALRDVAAHCANVTTPVRTGSDVNDATLTEEEIAAIGGLDDVESVCPLAPMQEGMLFAALRDPASPSYFEQSWYRIQGPLDPLRLREALERTVRRHAAMRTVFATRGMNRPRQIVKRTMEPVFEVIDISGATSMERQKALEEYAAREVTRPFDLSTGPLVRMTVLRAGPNEHDVILSLHHIVVDGWCMAILGRELFGDLETLHASAAVSDGESPPPPQFQEYVEWVGRKDRTAAAGYWRELLGGYETRAGIPRIQGRRTAAERVSSTLRAELPASLVEALTRLARTRRATLGALLHAAWGALLMRYNDTDDVVFGSVISGRPADLPGVEEMLGLFINTIPVRVTGTGDMTFADLLARTCEQIVRSEAQGFYPLADIQSCSDLGNGLIDHIFAFESFPGGGDGPEGPFQVTPIGGYDHPDTDFAVILAPAESLHIRLVYDATVHDRRVIEAIPGHLQRILETVIAQPEIPLREIDLLTPEERTRLLTRFSVGVLGPDRSMRARPVAPALPPVLPRRLGDGEVRLTPAQTAEDTLAHLMERKAPPDEILAVLIEGHIDFTRIGEAIDALVKRHEALRARVADGAMQVDARLKWRRVLRDGEGLSAAEHVEAFRAAHADAAARHRPRGGVFELVRLDGGRALLLAAVSPLLVDAASLDVLAADLAALYAGVALPAPARFSDYAAWLDESLACGALNDDRLYWMRLQGVPAASPRLPLDRPRPAHRQGACASVPVTLTPSAAQEVRDAVAATNADAQDLFAAALALVLAAHAHRTDLRFGLHFPNRALVGLERAVGRFGTTLPLRVLLDFDADGPTLLDDMRAARTEAIRHAAWPTELLPRALNLASVPGRGPLYDVVLAYETDGPTRGGARTARPGPAWRRLQAETSVARADLTFRLRDESDLLHGRLEYATDIFDESTATRLASELAETVKSLCMEGGQSVRERIARLRREPVEALGGAIMPQRLERTIHSVIREQAHRFAERTAVSCGDVRLTWRELDERTDRLAARLRADGVVPNQIVAVMVRRSVDHIVGALAVLKAGGAFLPLDPDYPDDRIRLMLEDSGARVFLSQEKLRGRVAWFDGPIIDLGASEWGEGPVPDVPDVNKPGDLVYVIYTSGSTGKPKGVMITHRNLISLCIDYVGFYQLVFTDKVGLHVGLGFDASIISIFPTLAVGAEVFVVPEALRLSPTDLGKAFNEHGVTHATFPTQFCEQFIESVDCPTLRTVETGGEALHSYRPRSYQLVNAYGPTECTVEATRFVVDRQYDNIPIGRPTANMWLHVVDHHRRLQPPGVPGELCIAGTQVGPGYLGRPELTAEKFVANPWSDQDANRVMYRTGDLVRWLPDGMLEFLGRIDQQVKIRGFRIELGEIEQRLLEQDGLHEAVVMALDEPGGGKALCAWVTPAGLDAEALRAALGRSLPDYMVPPTIMVLPALPVTANGKVDRKALPRPERAVATFSAPQTEAEKTIAAVFGEVLGVARVGRDDSFFTLGGHSIKAVAAAARLQRHFDVSINDLFAHPTVADLAHLVAPREASPEAALDAVLARLEHPPERPEAAIAAARAMYDEEIRSDDALDLTQKVSWRGVLLTGATGHLGIHLLEALRAPEAGGPFDLWLPVRAESDAAARERLLARAERALGAAVRASLEADARVHVFAADLSAERLGLSEERYAEVVASVDCIIHSAANVRHYGHLDELRRDNVTATERLLALARSVTPPAAFHQVSTISMGEEPGPNPPAVFTEDDAPAAPPENLYLRTKAEAEALVRAARAEGVDARIHRVGNLVFRSDNGGLQDNLDDNAFFTQLKGFLMLGVAPEPFVADLSYVDAAAWAVLTLARPEALRSRTFHIMRPEPRDMMAILHGRDIDMALRGASMPELARLLYRLRDVRMLSGTVERLLLHLGLLDAEAPERGASEVATERTDHLLARAGFHWPDPSPEALRPMLRKALAERIAFVSAKTLLGALPADAAEALAARARLEVFGDGDELSVDGGDGLRAGDGDGLRAGAGNVADSPRAEGEDGRVLLILDGKVQISATSAGGWLGTIGIAGPGEVLGAEHLVGDGSTLAHTTLEAFMGDVVALSVPRADVLRLMAAHPALAGGLLRVLGRRVRRLERMVVNVG